MRPVAVADIEAPALVKKGDLVTVVLKSGMLNLTVQGRAMQGGAEGDSVHVINTASNRLMEGVVTGQQTVAVQAPSDAL
jgi:flagella basal body P-ring formation protein FlgA